MQNVSRLLPRAAIALLGLLLALGMFFAVSSIKGSEANALSATEWETVAGALDSYITSQYVATDDGEAGFVLKGGPYNAGNPSDSLRGRLDSNGDGTILGEGDDAASVPVLVDVFSGTFIPGTALRFSNTNAADVGNATQVAAEVTQHRNAGFSTDIVSYCLTGHTESPPVAAYGAMSAAGYFGSPAPKSLGLKWGRLGWGGSTGAPGYTASGGTNPTAAAAGSFALPSNVACTGATPTAELERCTAANTLPTIGNVTSIADANQPVDIRSSLTGGTVKTAGGTIAIQNQLADLFDATGGTYDNLKKLDNSKTIVFINRAQHTAAIAATGAKMLGFVNAKYYKWGLPMWNKNAPSPGWPEQFSVASRGYDYGFTSAAIDSAAPTISGVAAAPTCSGATITWSTNEPATSKVEVATTPGGPYVTLNDTVLHGSHTVSLPGLPENTTFYFKVSSYDGLANGSTSAESSFTTGDCIAPAVAYTGPTGTIATSSTTVTGTASDSGSGLNAASATVSIDGGATSACTVDGSGNISCAVSGLADGSHTALIAIADNAGNTGSASGSFTVSTCTAGQPTLSLKTTGAFWASYADYTARNLSVKYTISNTGSTMANNVNVTGATATNGVTLVTSVPVALGNVAAAGSANFTLKYHVPTGVSGFKTAVTASAEDDCGNPYSYPTPPVV